MSDLVPDPKTGTVVGVLSPRRVNVASTGSGYYNVPIPQWYVPQLGDTVVLTFYNQGQCYVSMVLDDRAALYLQTIPTFPTITVQDTAPGGMSTISATYTQSGVTTNPNITFVRSTPVAPPTAPTVTSVYPATSNTYDSYYSGWRTDDNRPRQGSGPGASFGASGLWFYGSGAFGFLSGHTITSLTMTVERFTSGGAFAGVQLHPLLHSYATQPGGAPAFIGSDPVPAGASPSVGQGVTFSLPLSFATALQGGSAAGVGIYGGTSDYLVARAAGEQNAAGAVDSGVLTFTYT